MSVTTETIRKVYEDQAGAHIQVGPDGDALGLVEIKTCDTRSIEFFGDCNIVMNLEYARALACAIIKTCDDLVGNQS